MTIHCFKIIAHGQVQGVGFRYGTMQIANQLGIRGSVENLTDGTVLIIAQADQDSLDQFIKKIKQGPTPFAHVTGLEISEIPPQNLQLFVIK